MRREIAMMNPMLHRTIIHKSITFAYVHLRGHKSKVVLRKSLSDITGQTFNTAPLRNQQAMWHITTIWRSHWHRGRYIEDSRWKVHVTT